MVINTNGIGVFFVNVLVALAVFIGLLFFILRDRSQRPIFRIFLLAFIVVVCGMTISRITYGIWVPWWIFYGIPALITFLLPPLVLRMSKKELLFYVPLAIINISCYPCFLFIFHWMAWLYATFLCALLARIILVEVNPSLTRFLQNFANAKNKNL